MQQQIEQARAAGYSDEEIVQYLTQKGLVPSEQVQEAVSAGYSPTEIVAHFGKAGEPTWLQRRGREFGIAGRDTVMGLAGLPLMVGDAANTLVNLGTAGINKLAGTNIQPLPMASQGVESLLDKTGLPRPETRTERNISMAQRSAAGAGGAKVLGDALVKASRPAVDSLVRRVGELFATNPGAQTAAGITSGAATDIARNEFDVTDPYALLAIGMTTGMATPGGQAAAVSNPVTRGGQALVQPFTKQGQRAVAGSVLREWSTDADAAATRIGNGFPTLVPGSRPTTAEVAGDYGLTAAANPAFKALDTRNLRGQRVSENNTARMRELDRLARDEGAVQYAADKRDRNTAPMREQAFGQVTVDPKTFQSGVTLVVDRHIGDVLASPAGKRQDVETAMQWARSRIAKASTPDELYEVRKDLRAAAQGRYNQEQPSLRLAKGEMEGLIRTVDELIDSAAPGYKAYMDRYSTMSVPIDQMRTLQGLRERVTMAAPDPVTGTDIFSQANMKRRVADVLADRDVRLSTTQRAAIQRIVDDLNRAQAASTSAVARAPGSDTMKNFSMANLIGRVVGDKVYGTGVGNTVPRQVVQPLSWLYSLPDQKVADLIVEAMLDPMLYRELVKTASAVRIQPLSEALKAKALQTGIIAPAAVGIQQQAQ